MRALLTRILPPLTALAICALLLLAAEPPRPGTTPHLPQATPPPTSATQTPPTTPPSHGPLPRASHPGAVVTLGDSMLSGEGSGDYLPGTNGEHGDWCHRSPRAPISHMRLSGVSARINLACSGARSDQVGLNPPPGRFEGSQARQLSRVAAQQHIGSVVVQVGANDEPRFSDTVSQCIAAWASKDPRGCAGHIAGSWPNRVHAMQQHLTRALRDVQHTLQRAGYPRGSYNLVVLSYPSPVGPGVPPQLQNLSGCPFRTSDLQWVHRTAVPQLSQGVRAAAATVGARFLDMSHASDGHEACTHPQHPEQEWFTRLTVDWQSLHNQSRSPHAMQESFHPTPAGNAAFGHCTGLFLAGDASTAACRPDGRGGLAPVTTTSASGAPH